MELRKRFGVGILASALGQHDPGVSVDAIVWFDLDDICEFWIGDLPDIPDDPGIEGLVLGPGFLGFGTVGGKGLVMARRAFTFQCRRFVRPCLPKDRSARHH